MLHRTLALLCLLGCSHDMTGTGYQPNERERIEQALLLCENEPESERCALEVSQSECAVESCARDCDEELFQCLEAEAASGRAEPPERSECLDERELCEFRQSICEPLCRTPTCDAVRDLSTEMVAVYRSALSPRHFIFRPRAFYRVDRVVLAERRLEVDSLHELSEEELGRSPYWHRSPNRIDASIVYMPPPLTQLLEALRIDFPAASADLLSSYPLPTSDSLSVEIFRGVNDQTRLGPSTRPRISFTTQHAEQAELIEAFRTGAGLVALEAEVAPYYCWDARAQSFRLSDPEHRIVLESDCAQRFSRGEIEVVHDASLLSAMISVAGSSAPIEGVTQALVNAGWSGVDITGFGDSLRESLESVADFSTFPELQSIYGLEAIDDVATELGDLTVELYQRVLQANRTRLREDASMSRALVEAHLRSGGIEWTPVDLRFRSLLESIQILSDFGAETTRPPIICPN